MGDRYSPATAMGGRLYLDGRDGLAYCDEAVVDMLVERVIHRKARTEAELLAIVRESERGLPALRVWGCTKDWRFWRGGCGRNHELRAGSRNIAIHALPRARPTLTQGPDDQGNAELVPEVIGQLTTQIVLGCCAVPQSNEADHEIVL